MYILRYGESPDLESPDLMMLEDLELWITSLSRLVPGVEDALVHPLTVLFRIDSETLVRNQLPVARIEVP